MLRLALANQVPAEDVKNFMSGEKVVNRRAVYILYADRGHGLEKKEKKFLFGMIINKQTFGQGWINPARFHLGVASACQGVWLMII